MAAAQTWDAIVVGGGIAGLTCAIGLVDHGCRVLVLERDAVPGGRARSWRDEVTGDVVDIGPHVVHSRYRNFLKLLRRLGTGESIFWQRDPLVTLVDAGVAHRLPASRLVEPLHMLAPLRKVPLPLADKLSNVGVTLRAMAMDDADFSRLDGLPASAYLAARGVSPRLAAWFWASVCITIMNVSLERCSTGALLRFYQQLIGHRDAVIGFPRIDLGALAAVPACAAIARAGGEVRTATAAARLEYDETSVRDVVLASGERCTAKACVLAVSPMDLVALAPPGTLVANAARRLAAPPPSSYYSVYLWFDRKLTQEAFWSRTWGERKLSFDCYDLSSIRSGWEGRDSVIAANVIDSARLPPLDDAQIVAGVTEDIAELAPAVRDAKLIHARVHRVPMAIPYPLPGTESMRPTTRTRLPNLFVASDWCDTRLPCSMESAACSGWQAAEAVLGHLGRPARLAEDYDLPRGLTGLTRRLRSALRS